MVLAGDKDMDELTTDEQIELQQIKSQYHNIIYKLIQLTFNVNPQLIPSLHLYKNIKHDEPLDFSNLSNFNTKLGADLHTTLEDDERVQNLKIKKWKPLHYMIYFGHNDLLTQLLFRSRRNVRRVLTVDNNKKHTSDERIALKLAVRLHNTFAFSQLWKLTQTWSLKHLNSILKEFYQKDGYRDDLMKILLTSDVTKDIIIFAPEDVRTEIYKRITKLIDKYSEHGDKMHKAARKLFKSFN